MPTATAQPLLAPQTLVRAVRRDGEALTTLGYGFATASLGNVRQEHWVLDRAALSPQAQATFEFQAPPLDDPFGPAVTLAAFYAAATVWWATHAGDTSLVYLWSTSTYTTSVPPATAAAVMFPLSAGAPSPNGSGFPDPWPDVPAEIDDGTVAVTQPERQSDGALAWSALEGGDPVRRQECWFYKAGFASVTSAATATVATPTGASPLDAVLAAARASWGPGDLWQATTAWYYSRLPLPQ